MASANFTYLCEHLANARINFATDTLKAVIVSSIPTEANLDAWDFLNDVTNEIAAGGGYTTGVKYIRKVILMPIMARMSVYSDPSGINKIPIAIPNTIRHSNPMGKRQAVQAGTMRRLKKTGTSTNN